MNGDVELIDRDDRAKFDPVGDVDNFATSWTSERLGQLAEFSRRGDLGATECFVEILGKPALRYVREARRYYHFQQGRWTPDHGDAAMQLVQRMPQILYDAAASCEAGSLREQIAKLGVRCESRRQMESILKLAEARPQIVVSAADFDRDPLELNVANGVVDLRTGHLRERMPGELFAKASPVAFDPQATCPRWLKFLREIFRGDDDLITFVQRAVGYSLTGLMTEQILLVLYGVGANGKSTFIGTVRSVLGDYAVATATETFMGRARKASSNDVARLAGARFVSAVEVEAGHTLSEGFVKAITGGDAITARFLFREYFEFNPTFKPWLAVNQRPEIRGSDFGIWRRIRLVPFEARFEGDADDKGLAAKLAVETPGILAWAVRGCLEWRQRGLESPTAVLLATAAYRADMDVFEAFLSDCCDLRPDGFATGTALYAAHHTWADRNGEKALSATKLGIKLRERGDLQRDRTKHGVRWVGITVRDDGVTGLPTFAEPFTNAHARDYLPQNAVNPSSRHLGSGADEAREW